MSFKNPKNLIVVGVAVAALLAGTVLLGGYAYSNAAENEAPVKACQVTSSDAGCPLKANQDAFAQVSGDVQTESGCSGKPCAEECTKPCCADEAPKSCCGTAESTGCPMTAEKTAAE